jgi:hypothetical protein
MAPLFVSVERFTNRKTQEACQKRPASWITCMVLKTRVNHMISELPDAARVWGDM